MRAALVCELWGSAWDVGRNGMGAAGASLILSLEVLTVREGETNKKNYERCPERVIQVLWEQGQRRVTDNLAGGRGGRLHHD